MLIGAHYYPWYTSQWSQLTIRGKLVPMQQPVLGWYNNALPSGRQVVQQHFKLCKDKGIDFLSMSWNGYDLKPYLDLAEQANLKLCIHYETLLRGNTSWITELCPNYSKDLSRISDWLQHPSMLRIDDKPVIMYYVMRAGIKSVIKDFVQKIRDTVDVFLVGDVVFYDKPNKDFLSIFDAVYGYNMYIHEGAPVNEKLECNMGFTGNAYLDFIEPFEDAFFQSTRAAGVAYWPTVLPGYNDRGVRYNEGHYVIPREGTKFFREYLKYASKFLGDGVLLVTSFNEWYEDTQLEPVLPSCATRKSFGREDLTQGCEYETYTTEYLDLLHSYKAEYENHLPSQTIERILSDPRQVNKRLPKILIEQWKFLHYILTYRSDKVLVDKIDHAKRVYVQITEHLHALGIDTRLHQAAAVDTYRPLP